MQRSTQFILIVLLVSLFGAGILILLSSDSMNWRLSSLLAQARYALDPPQEAVFVPQHSPSATPPAAAVPLPSRTATISLITPTAAPVSPVPSQTPTPTLVPTPLPAQASLTGVQHQFQMWNNCGPANLSMGLSYWGWRGDQRDTAAFLKPNDRDKNVMPYEMEVFVEQETDFEAVSRVGGSLPGIKALIASGFPVIAEKGFEGEGFDGWMGHYQVLTGYDDASGNLIAQDSNKGPDYTVPYEDLLADWRAFNNTYLVIYPADRRQQVLDLLGLQAYDNFNQRAALQLSAEEVQRLSGRDLFFAYFNQGTNLVNSQDYAQAAAAYDTAFANYALLQEAERPWRMMWYQTGPYFAYYFSERYQDVINLATQTLEAASEPILEESFYWRGRAFRALGDVESAQDDLESCLIAHPGFDPCIQELWAMGIEPPPTRAP